MSWYMSPPRDKGCDPVISARLFRRLVRCFIIWLLLCYLNLRPESLSAFPSEYSISISIEFPASLSFSVIGPNDALVGFVLSNPSFFVSKTEIFKSVFFYDT